MFGRLRWRLALFNTLVTCGIVAVAFAAIYLVSAAGSNARVEEGLASISRQGAPTGEYVSGAGLSADGVPSFAPSFAASADGEGDGGMRSSEGASASGDDPAPEDTLAAEDSAPAAEGSAAAPEDILAAEGSTPAPEGAPAPEDAAGSGLSADAGPSGAAGGTPAVGVSYVDAATAAPRALVSPDGSVTPLSLGGLSEADLRSLVAAAQDAAPGSRVEAAGRSWRFEASYLGGFADGTGATTVTTDASGQGQLASGASVAYAFLDVTDEVAGLRLLAASLVAGGALVAALVLLASLAFARRSLRPAHEAWERERRFVADASHELKTPLAAMGANLDALEANGEQTVASQARWTGYLRQSVDDMTGLVRGLLDAARADEAADAARASGWVGPLARRAPRSRAARTAGAPCGRGGPFASSGPSAPFSPEAPLVPVDTCAVARSVADGMASLAAGRGVSFEVAPPGPLRARVPEEGLREVLGVLLDNAVRYSDAGGRVEVALSGGRGRVEVALSERHGRVTVRVSNGGAGIDPLDLPHVFDRFWRASASRTPGEGYGLGLAIARARAEAMGGTLTAQSEPGVRTTFTLTLPGA